MKRSAGFALLALAACSSAVAIIAVPPVTESATIAPSSATPVFARKGAEKK